MFLCATSDKLKHAFAELDLIGKFYLTQFGLNQDPESFFFFFTQEVLH